MADIDVHDLTDRYVAVWNEPDAERRRAAVRALWSADAVHVLRPPQEIRDVVKFNWEMAPRDGGEVAGVGLEVLVLGPDGRIVSDYQFIEG
ncbi:MULTISPECIES: hypothetical protein [unclassified Streptomyces]|uniref:hypothetical protein n=1 Tax=unclassified Streptomyces TaxID=2593676 RepID=UPI0003712BAA|nr:MULTISPECIES: hypothetical protein [unclassified Streptomyces]MYQ79422.1 hypothetical protein [Streptomyces sp. SID4923]